MDRHSHQVDLNALSKLYFLVQNNDPGGQSLVTKVLDESSSIYLRKLLDEATKRVYEARGKNIANPYSSSLASSSASSYEKAASRTTKRYSTESDSKISEYSDFDSSSRTQYGKSQSRTTSDSSFDNAFDHSDDELSPSEYYQSKRRSSGHRNIGKLSRLKDKLGSIFHHHHHHHHHHHKRQHPHDKIVIESGSLWKKYGKLFMSHEKSAEAKIEKKYVGTKKKKVEAKNQKSPTVTKGKHEQRNKQQDGHFQERVGGLTRNLKKLNKPKQEGAREKNCSKVTRKPRGPYHCRRDEF